MRDTVRASPDRASERKRTPAARTPAEPLLELQRAVGNRAARTVLAREPVEADTRRETTIELKDLGTIGVLSYSFGTSNSVGGSGGRGEAPANKDINVTTEPGDHTPKLMQAATNGKRFETVVIKAPAITITLKNAFISGYHTGSGQTPTDSWSLSYESIEYKYAGGG